MPSFGRRDHGRRSGGRATARREARAVPAGGIATRGTTARPAPDCERRPVPNARSWLFSRDESGWWRIDRDAVGLEILVGVELEVDAREVLVIERVRIAIMGDHAPIFAAKFSKLAHLGPAASGAQAV